MMTALPRPATQEHLFLWVMHRFAEVFEDQAILKGGYQLRLLDSQRMTNDIDFVFVPYRSKKKIAPLIREVLQELEEAQIEMSMHSKMVRFVLALDDCSIIVECDIAEKCRSVAMTTDAVARTLGETARIIRVMEPSVALAHKLAAWNERRLLRDLYDAYFYLTRVGVTPDMVVLKERLQSISSCIPALRKKTQMNLTEFSEALDEYLHKVRARDFEQELAGVLSSEQRVGLLARMKAALRNELFLRNLEDEKQDV